MDNSISLNKFISDTGYCSRREADDLITQGRVFLNNRPAVLGNRYKPGDTVEVDGSLVTAAKKEKRVYLALNKPPGITTTTESHIKDNIISFVGYHKRIFPIGRLDKESEGLILLTNDGDIINKILRADNNHEKEYVVKVNKAIEPSFIHQMANGVPILDTVTLPCKVQPVGRQAFRITLTQGLNRQIRRMCEYLGYSVLELQRVRIMNIKLDKLPMGKWRYLSEAELEQLNENLADSAKVDNAGKSAPRKHKGAAPQSPKRDFTAKKTPHEGRGKDDKTKSAKPAATAGKPKTGKKEEKPWKRDNATSKAGKKDEKPWKRDNTTPAKKAASAKHGGKPTRSDKNAGKEKKDPVSRKEKRFGAEGSFKNFRSKGRR